MLKTAVNGINSYFDLSKETSYLSSKRRPVDYLPYIHDIYRPIWMHSNWIKVRENRMGNQEGAIKNGQYRNLLVVSLLFFKNY
jgi:hypothetical protein